MAEHRRKSEPAALREEVRRLREIIRHYAAAMQGQRTAHVEVYTVGKAGRLSFLITDPLGDEERMARLFASAWAAIAGWELKRVTVAKVPDA